MLSGTSHCWLMLSGLALATAPLGCGSSDAVDPSDLALAGTIAFKQSASSELGAPASSLTLKFTSVRSGDLLVGWFANYDSPGTVMVSDSLNGAWTRAGAEQFDGASGDVALYYKANSRAGNLVITVSTSAATYIQATASEYAGADIASPLDQVVTDFGNGRTASAGPTAALAAPNELVYAAVSNGANVSSMTAGSGFTLRSHAGATGAQDRPAGSTSGQRASLAFSDATDWNMVIATFKPAGGSTDASAPTIAVVTPSVGATVSGTVSVTGTASDNVAVASVAVAVDAGVFNSANGTTGWSYSLDTTALGNGSHTITARAQDAAGNTKQASVTVTVSNTVAAGGSPIVLGTTCPVFPADNVWNRDISTLPVHAKSSTWVNSIGTSKKLDLGFGPPIYGIPYAITDASTPKTRISFSDTDDSYSGLYPFTSSTPIEQSDGGDAHAIMIDKSTCSLYEMFAASWNNGSPAAWGGFLFNLTSNVLGPDGVSSADDAGLPIYPGLTRFDEVQAGAIRHAMRFTAQNIDATVGSHLWPARYEASYTGTASSNLPPMGARFRLKAGFDSSTYSAKAQVVLTALKHYGMFLADIGNDWGLAGTYDPSWSQSLMDELRTVSASQFEVVDESQLMVDPNSGQAKQ